MRQVKVSWRMGWFMRADLKFIQSYEVGTYRTLNEAINLALMVGPLEGLQERLKTFIREYLSRQFCDAYLSAYTEREVELLRELWLQISGDM